MSSEINKSVRGKRYTSEEKSEVVNFVTNYNASHGRGGQNAASEKFGISALSISNWMKAANGGATTNDNLQETLNKMMVLGKEIDECQRELTAKRLEFNVLKKALR